MKPYVLKLTHIYVKYFFTNRSAILGFGYDTIIMKTNKNAFIKFYVKADNGPLKRNEK